MKAIKVILLILIFVVLVTGLSAIQVGVAVGRTALNPDFYIRTLDQSGLYEALPNALMSSVLGEFLGQVPASERPRLEAAFLEAANPEWTKAQLDTLIRDFFRFIRGQDAQLKASFPAGEFSDRFVAAYQQAGGSAYAVRMLQQALEENLPDTFMLSEVEGLPAQQSLLPPGILAWQQFILAGPIVFVLVWLLLALLCFPLAGGFPGGARWIGASCLVSGFGTMLASIPTRSLSRVFIASGEFAEMPPGLETFNPLEFALAATGRVFTELQIIAGIVIAVAILLLVAASLVAAARRRRAQGVGADAAPDAPKAPETAPESAPEETSEAGSEPAPESEPDGASEKPPTGTPGSAPPA